MAFDNVRYVHVDLQQQRDGKKVGKVVTAPQKGKPEFLLRNAAVLRCMMLVRLSDAREIREKYFFPKSSSLELSNFETSWRATADHGTACGSTARRPATCPTNSPFQLITEQSNCLAWQWKASDDVESFPNCPTNIAQCCTVDVQKQKCQYQYLDLQWNIHCWCFLLFVQ